MRGSPTGSCAAIALAIVLVASPACSVSGLDFVQDQRLEITAPRDRAEVTLPLTVRWTVRDFEVTGRSGRARGDAGYFGVFVDRAPQPPQHTLESLGEDDPLCRSNPSCPDEEFLAGLNVFSTNRTSFEVRRLPAPGSEAPRRREFHEVTIVLLDGQGRRIGESAFTVEFEVRR